MTCNLGYEDASIPTSHGGLGCLALLGLCSLYMLPGFSAVRAKETHDSTVDTQYG